MPSRVGTRVEQKLGKSKRRKRLNSNWLHNAPQNAFHECEGAHKCACSSSWTRHICMYVCIRRYIVKMINKSAFYLHNSNVQSVRGAARCCLWSRKSTAWCVLVCVLVCVCTRFWHKYHLWCVWSYTIRSIYVCMCACIMFMWAHLHSRMMCCLAFSTPMIS